MRRRMNISPFSVILVMLALSVIGIVSIGRLHIQYKPTRGGQSISVSYALSGASAEVVESEVTSKIEGVLSGLKGCTGTSSISGKGSGSVTVSFDRKTDMAAARFDVASAIRNIYPSLPSNATYPAISLNSSGNTSSTAISYQIKGSLPSLELSRFAERSIQPEISLIEGVDKVTVIGSTPYHWVITFDAAQASALGISAYDISSAFRHYFQEEMLGMTEEDGHLMAVRLEVGGNHEDFGSIPIKRSADRLVYLRDIADWKYVEALPDSYYRINGLNTVTLSVSVSENSNLVSSIKAVKRKIAELQEDFPREITVSVGYDSSEYVAEELNKIYLRTGLCLLILLLFVLITNRSWKNTFIVAASLTVNILISIAFYAFLGIPVHIYTLAGITVSLGIVIDSTIVMSDHYAYYRDRGAFPDLVMAILTTVAALLMILLLPESERGNLTDFIWVIAINLCVSLAVAFFFIPALMEYLPQKRVMHAARSRRSRRVIKWNSLYSKYISWGTRHRWVYVVIFIAAFGIPLFLIPEPSSREKGPFYEKFIRPVISWKPYASNRENIDKWTGSTFRLFYNSLKRSNFYREPQKLQLDIRASMPEGCSVQQLNEVMKSMENYLASFDEISVFTTSIDSYDRGTITVEFKPEYENTNFPLLLKSKVTAMAINFGGASWTITGIDDTFFNNNIGTAFKTSNIALHGYNYRELHSYAEVLADYLEQNPRVSGLEIWSSAWMGRPETEYVLDYDFSRLAALGASPYSYYGALSSLVYDERVTSVRTGEDPVEVVLRSSDTDVYDIWHMLNEPVQIDSVKATLADVGSLVKKQSGLDIRKENQSYSLCVCFDFIGSYELARKTVLSAVDYMNDEVLPLGFQAGGGSAGWFENHKERYAWLILLIVLVIYVMLAMAFESLRYPLPVIFMIPISFIGLFLVFGVTDFAFDQGGFAAFVMLCGVVVNAGIYLVNSWQKQKKRYADPLKAYVRAYNHKINPIMLTILSTILGLLPFLTDGPTEVFWFDFAVGTIGGMIFSVIALLLVLPVFLLKRR